MMSSVETVPKESKKDSSNGTTHSEGNNLQDYANNGTVASNATTYTHASGNPVSSVASDQHPNSLAFIPAHSAAALQMPYSPFPAGDGSWTTPPFDPNLMAGFSFTGPNMIAPGHLQNQFYFPGADMGIWGQEPLANQLLMSYSLLSPVAMDQTGNAVPLDATGVANSVDPISGLGQTFSGIALNGSMPGMMMGQAPLMSTTSSSSGSLEDVGQSSGSVPNPGQMSNAPQPEKPKSWAAIASQPAKPRPPPPPKPQPQPETFQEVTKKPQTGTGMNRGGPSTSNKGQGQGTGAGKGGGMRRTAQQQQSQQQPSGAMKAKSNQSNIVGKLQSENKYNPSDLTLSLNNARFFVIKSYAEDDIHRSIKYNIWTSTEHGNRRLDQAFRELNGKGNMYLFYSVNGSGHFCGMAQMTSGVDFNTTTGVWAQDKWKGRIEVKWIYVKDVPNSQLRHIRLENNENKPVTNSRDTQEIPMEKGKQVIKIVHNYHHTTSIFDDFEHYEKKQEEEESRKKSS